MDVKEKLIELLQNAKSAMKSENLSCDIARNMFVVDFMMANGVTVQELDGCKYCKEYEDLPEHFIDGKPVGRVFDTCIQRNENGLWHLGGKTERLYSPWIPVCNSWRIPLEVCGKTPKPFLQF